MITLPRPLRGIVPPVLTPLSGRDTVDQDSYARLLDQMVGAGVSALFILGSTGESPGLTAQARRTAIERAVKTVAGRVPILVGITDPCFSESVSLADFAAQAGAAALVLSAPYYYPLSQSAFLSYLERIVTELPLPLYLYNMPRYTKLAIKPETVRAAAQLPNIYGLKDSSGDREYFRRVREAVSDRPDFAVLVGIEENLAQAVMEDGAHGGVCGGANLAPELYVQLYEAAARGDAEAVKPLNRRVLDISSAIYGVGDPASSYLRGLKCAVSLAGFGNGAMAEPYWAFRDDEREEIRQALLRLGLLR